ncbi:MAG TPA: MFS transporter, partial [Actinomycetota bacterium]|nr:MFS transporter [Actinomycetota bacterium]
MLRPMRRRDFALLWGGMTISLLGDGMYFVAVAWLVLRLSNSPTALGIVGVAWTVPQVITLLWGGVASDRFDRRKVMIGADIVRGIPIAIIGFLALSHSIELWHVFVLVAIYGAGEGFFMPAFSALVPDVVPKAELIEANALDQFVRPLTLRFAGPAVGGFIIAAFGVGTAFLIDATTFLVSALAVTAIRTRRPRAERSSETSTWKEIREGLNYVRTHSWLWVTLTATAIALLAFYGPFQVLVPFLVKNGLDGSAQDLGLVFAVGGIGAIVASLVMGQRGLPRRHITFVYIC